MSLLPLIEIVTRKFFQWGVPGSSIIVQHLTLVIAFLGAALAAREGRLLKLATGEALAHGRFGHVVGAFGAAVGACVTAALCYASLQLVLTERGAGLVIVPGVKRWAVEAVMPNISSRASSSAPLTTFVKLPTLLDFKPARTNFCRR